MPLQEIRQYFVNRRSAQGPAVLDQSRLGSGGVRALQAFFGVDRLTVRLDTLAPAQAFYQKPERFKAAPLKIRKFRSVRDPKAFYRITLVGNRVRRIVLVTSRGQILVPKRMQLRVRSTQGKRHRKLGFELIAHNYVEITGPCAETQTAVTARYTQSSSGALSYLVTIGLSGEVFQALLSDLYWPELGDLALGNPRLLLASADTWSGLRPVPAGVSLRTDLGFGQNLGAAVVPPLLPLTLQGFAAEPGRPLRMVSDPAFVLRFPDASLRDLALVVNHRWLEGTVETDTQVVLTGLWEPVQGLRLRMWSPLPPDHGALVLRWLGEPGYTLQDLAVLDPLMGGQSDWWEAVPQGIRDVAGDFTLRGVTLTVDLPSQVVTNVQLELEGAGRLRPKRFPGVVLAGLRWTFLVGFPFDDQERSVLVDAEGMLWVGDAVFPSASLRFPGATIAASSRAEAPFEAGEDDGEPAGEFTLDVNRFRQSELFAAFGVSQSDQFWLITLAFGAISDLQLFLDPATGAATLLAADDAGTEHEWTHQWDQG
jgi:hypothetical protein